MAAKSHWQCNRRRFRHHEPQQSLLEAHYTTYIPIRLHLAVIPFRLHSTHMGHIAKAPQNRTGAFYRCRWQGHTLHQGRWRRPKGSQPRLRAWCGRMLAGCPGQPAAPPYYLHQLPVSLEHTHTTGGCPSSSQSCPAPVNPTHCPDLVKVYLVHCWPWELPYMLQDDNLCASAQHQHNMARHHSTASAQHGMTAQHSISTA